jgi:hypothetical protein
MPKAGSSRKKKATIAIVPDCDKLGLVAATLVASVVLLINLFFVPLDILEVVFRVSVTFVVTWAIAAPLARYILYATDVEPPAGENEEVQDQEIGDESEIEEFAEVDASLDDRGDVE